MHIRKLALAVLLIGTGSAHAQFGAGQMMNPMTMMAPMGMMGMGGMMNPMTMMAPMAMMAAPMMMPMGANMMSAQMYQPQSMTNPYLNPMAASNPYLNPSAGMANPFMMMQPAAPAYGGYGMPAAPAQAAPMMFFPMMPAAAAAPAVAPPSAAAAPASTPFDPAMWMKMMSGMAPATPAATPEASK